MYDHEPVVTAGAELGEGPVWHAAEGVLLWLDILGRQVHRFDPATGQDTARTYPEPITALAPGQDGRLLAAVADRVAPLDSLDQPLVHLPTGDRGNDGACDPYGRFLIGTYSARHEPGGCALYRVDGPGALATVVDQVTLSNGLDFNPAGDLMYFVDTPTRRVDVFDYHPDGTATGRRTFADLSDAPGRPDGLTVDAEGGVWVALVRGGQLRRYDQTGWLDEVIDVPANRVTSCGFGGPDLDELYLTTGWFGMTPDEREPLAGALFRLRPGVAGKPPHLWRPPI